jgi:hypothetical protein
VGSKPWKNDLIYRLLSSEDYREHRAFTLTRGQRSWTGPIECGPAVIWVEVAGEPDPEAVAVPIDRVLEINGTPAPEWREEPTHG